MLLKVSQEQGEIVSDCEITDLPFSTVWELRHFEEREAIEELPELQDNNTRTQELECRMDDEVKVKLFSRIA